ncbi:helix-turn-helix domain-containing protein [Neobacillus dielmonensis]|uniref:helix-turn-helix domain-containing protein n=1 Tax=Neobacillus dielmonensis TaxID=1347369 RepID=UPI0005A645D4|nr:helix-turn-helix transcriptional regulator [Neobacillus dielmonensis]
MFGERLKKLRLEHGLTMEEAGRRLGIKKSTYASYESEYRQPPLEKLKGISKLFGVSVDYILGLTDERNIQETLQYKLMDAYKKGFHWDGQDIPEDVLQLISQVLEELSQKQWQRYKES